ncbi:glycosyltransferase [Actinosynnema sp. NPDC020468]|uniref:glycosyltransferase n=1 Tax=Actinosynnema sp. NPDC020468 TaxID=3154488 RepID=UPI0033C4C105
MTSVAIVSLNYAPDEHGVAPYSTGLARGLAARGHRVRLLTGFPYYPRWRLPESYRRFRRGLAHTEREEGVDVTRLWHHVPRRSTGVGRVVHEASFAVHAAVRAFLDDARPDVVVGVSPSLLSLGAARLWASRAKVPLGVVVHDLYGRSTSEAGAVGGGRVAAAERALLARADGVAVIHESFRDHLAEVYGIPPERTTVIRNWVHVGGSPSVDQRDARVELGWPTGGIVALHAGNMGVKQDLVNVVEAARIAQHRHEPVHFVLMGDGATRPEVARRAAGLTHVSVVGPVTRELLPTALGAADVLVVNERPGMLGMSLPSKLTSYFCAGRPVVAAAHRDSSTAAELAASRGGCLVEPGDPLALLRAVVDLGGDPVRAAELARAGLRYAHEELGQERALAAYDRWLHDLGGAR